MIADGEIRAEPPWRSRRRLFRAIEPSRIDLGLAAETGEPPRSLMSARWAAAWFFALGACLSACVYLVPGDLLDLAYRTVSLRVASESFGALAALAFAYVIVGRGRGALGAKDALLVAALLIWSVQNLVFLAIPTAHAYGYTSRFSAWTSSGTRVIAAALFLLAALAPRRNLRVGRRTAVAATVVASLVVCVALALAVAALGDKLPSAVKQSLSPVGRTTVLPAGSGAIALFALISAALFASAAVLVPRGLGADEALQGWLAVGLAAASLAAFNFALFPTEYSQWVDLGDIFDFGFSLALVAGIAAELRHYWRRLVAAAVFEERRRIARDLHDGVAQELAFIVLEAECVAGSGPEALGRIVAAAERARMEVRLAIAAFIEPLEASVAANVERTAHDVARSRCAVDVRACGAEFVTTSSEREALHWITREAVSNAIRHGGAGTVRLRLLRSHRSRLFRVVDDGRGFDGSSRTDGFGMAIMRERADRVGASFSVRSVPGSGTAVQVVFPPRSVISREPTHGREWERSGQWR